MLLSLGLMVLNWFMLKSRLMVCGSLSSMPIITIWTLSCAPMTFGLLSCKDSATTWSLNMKSLDQSSLTLTGRRNCKWSWIVLLKDNKITGNKFSLNLVHNSKLTSEMKTIKISFPNSQLLLHWLKRFRRWVWWMQCNITSISAF